ncbi:unnamed protein product [Larinioides sclopetarius]|uniref:Uncharacterized protein n=1 Tax=Larinioides sclopetarius TaxID=280406 RepID=A0AAV1YYC8_9ARAC
MNMDQKYLRNFFAVLKKFECHHSSFNKVPAGKNKKGMSKDAACQASITVKIKLNTMHTRKRDDFVRQGLCGVIIITPFHTHSLMTAETLRCLPAGNCREVFEEYFNAGMGTAKSSRHHIQILEKNPDFQPSDLNNSRINPTRRTIAYWREQWKNRNLEHRDENDETELEKDMKNYMRYKLQGGKVFIKEDVIPHIFKCQASVTATSKKRKAQKRKLLDIAAAGLMDSQPTAPTSAAANLDVRSHATDVPVTVKKEICDESIQLEKDLRNYMRYKLQGGSIFIKKGVVPHIFKCQTSHSSTPKRPKRQKRKRRGVVARLTDGQSTASASTAANHVEKDASDVPDTVKKELMDESIQSSGTASREEEKKKDHIPLEPTILIKEEPLDYNPTPSTSTDTANEEFILPHEENTWTPPVPAPLETVVEPQFTLSVASLAVPNDPENPEGEQVKKKRKTNTSTFVPSTNGSEMKPQSPVYNFSESSNPGSSKDPRKDQFDVFGEYIAAKLRSLDRRSCAHAQKAIGDIIFEAEMGKFLDGDCDSKDLKNCAS